MVFFLLPFLFNPFGLLFSSLPGLYLAAWPIIIQTLGREALLTHALVLIIFILTCDITRQTMLKLIGFDLISLPISFALLAYLITDKGSLILSLLRPLFSGLLVVSEPVFLLIETYLVLDMIRSFNKWLSGCCNVHDENSNDLSSWEPPLVGKAIFARIFTILLASFSYCGIYLIIRESVSLLGGLSEDTPVNFFHAIAALLTLQVVAFSLTIYKEEGILSEAAIVTLFASIPLFIASRSYYHLKESTQTNSSSWTSYFPFSLLGIVQISSNDEQLAGGIADESATILLEKQLFGDTGDGVGASLLHRDSAFYTAHHIDFAPFENSFNSFGAMDTNSRQLLIGSLRWLIMIINSILGLSLDKLAKYYFGPDFWYVLGARLACLSWWALRSARTGANQAAESSDSQNNWRSGAGGDQATYYYSADDDEPLLGRLKSRWQALSSWLPITKRTLIKVLLVLGYTQMLVQQMDNRHHLQEQAALLTAADSQNDAYASSGAQGSLWQSKASSCCAGNNADHLSAQDEHHKQLSGFGSHGQEDNNVDSKLANWFSCMWANAKACSGGQQQQEQTNRIANLIIQTFEFVRDSLGQLVTWTMALPVFAYRLLTLLGSFLYSVHVLWLARWRSPIIQRLFQSMLVHMCYITRLVLYSDEDAERNIDH